MTARYLTGDVFEQMTTLPDSSVDLVLTSPPFLALRSYLPADHPDKAKEIGSEPNPAAFIDTLLRLTAEWDRLLAPHGSICIELGDTYSGSGGGGGDYLPGGLREDQPGFGGSAARQREGNAAHWRQKNSGPKDAWPLAKSLALIPELYRIALAYGVNPLTGEASPAGRWRVRNVVRWHRPNPPVGALGDKFRPSTSDMVIACKSAKRYFDLDAVREPHKEHTLKYDGGTRPAYGERGGQGTVTEMAPGAKSNPAGAPPLDTWIIPTHPYRGAHYASFPPELCVRPIKAMCPERVCTTCGEPSQRITERTPGYAAARSAVGDFNRRGEGQGSSGPRTQQLGKMTCAENVTVGWTDCGHDTWRPGTVLDPFAGSGTTLMVATGHGRNAIGIDLDPRNVDLARQRVGMFLEEGAA